MIQRWHRGLPMPLCAMEKAKAETSSPWAYCTDAGWRGLLSPGKQMCSVHARLGDSYLSHTCSQYPRLPREIGMQFRQGLHLSYPEGVQQA
jgi:hypothetical protein